VTDPHATETLRVDVERLMANIEAGLLVGVKLVEVSALRVVGLTNTHFEQEAS